MWNKESDLFLWGISILSILSASEYLDEETFSGPLPFFLGSIVNCSIPRGHYCPLSLNACNP